MISALFLISQKGEVVLNRFYRDDVSRRAADNFRLQVIAAKETGTLPPVKVIDGCSFLYTRHENLYLVAVSRANINAALVFQFLYQLNIIFKEYFGKKYNEDTIRDNFTLVYELLDETMDHGYPQNCSSDVLKLFINLGSSLATPENPGGAPPSQLTSQITGAIDWRREGIRYKRNEVYLDVFESVNLLMSSNGTVLRNEVAGQVVMKTLLTGMPECKLGLNDKLTMQKGDAPLPRWLAKSAARFELMKYRVTENINLPFKIMPAYQEQGTTRLSVTLKLASLFSPRLFATNVVIKIPVPMFTSSGLHVRFLKVFEKSSYPTTKWVRYVTRAGQYQLRI
ncbi:hypothetical protein AM588_10000911 [Phytophthora nicotianae]|uniref:MHD domain-containing protein n=1 Tax=Phytophthora nicotianae TaxID=4792 RepID=A0A0W8CE66_PHYNI|nr:hypothetical protein AM588_10000911 [Phytophthora nicotianae]